jgi:hypothetical protein
MIDFEAVFCDVDDFCQAFLPAWHRQLLTQGERRRQRASRLTLSEILTILIVCHPSQDRTVKAFSLLSLSRYARREFPQLLSDTRFVAVIPGVLMPLRVSLNTRHGIETGIAFVDSTTGVVCHHRRIHNHKVFKQVARRGKNSMGWFDGFKLHLIVNDHGELLAFRITPGNVDDRQPVPDLTQGLTGKLIGERGDLSQRLFNELWKRGLHRITKIRKNRHNQLMPLMDKLL